MIKTCTECGAEFKDSAKHTKRFCRPECRKTNWQRNVMAPRSIEARFWPKVNKTDGCWLWIGATNGQTGHGQFGIGDGHVYAHRYSYELAHGPIPKGLMVRHTCDNPPCVNPDHLVLGTSRQNVRDMVSRGRTRAQQHPETVKRGQQHPHARFTDNDILSMRQAFADGMSAAELADQYKTRATCVNRIVGGRSWTHLPNPALPRYLETRPRTLGKAREAQRRKGRRNA